METKGESKNREGVELILQVSANSGGLRGPPRGETAH
jgi:hypothetical protein